MNQLDQKLHEKLGDYVQDAHTLEKAIVKNLDSMRGTLDDPTLDGLLERHRKVIGTHVQRLELRLEELGIGSSVRKSSRAGGGAHEERDRRPAHGRLGEGRS